MVLLKAFQKYVEKNTDIFSYDEWMKYTTPIYRLQLLLDKCQNKKIKLVCTSMYDTIIGVKLIKY